MAQFNKVILAGHLTRDPEIRYARNGTAVTRLGLAVNTTSGQGDDRHETVCFIDVTVFGRQAETVAEHLTKGSPALIEGRLEWRTWESREGQKHSQHAVIAERVQFLGTRPPTDGPAPVPDGPRADDEDDIPFVRSDLRDGLSPSERHKFLA
jgi:single-strand DNA-binding protein